MKNPAKMTPAELTLECRTLQVQNGRLKEQIAFSSARQIERADAKLHGWRWLLKWRRMYRANLIRAKAISDSA